MAGSLTHPKPAPWGRRLGLTAPPEVSWGLSLQGDCLSPLDLDCGLHFEEQIEDMNALLLIYT